MEPAQPTTAGHPAAAGTASDSPTAAAGEVAAVAGVSADAEFAAVAAVKETAMDAGAATAGVASTADSATPPEPAAADATRVYPMAPVIRFTLLALYLALVLPLPLLAPADLRLALGLAVPLGLLPVLALTSERVELDGEGLRVGHPAWCARWLRRGWSLPWARITALTPVRTSQGGSVYYVRAAADDREGPSAWLLPQRVQHFDDFLARFAARTGLDTTGIGRISPPWTYQLLAVLCGLLLAGELVVLSRTLFI